MHRNAVALIVALLVGGPGDPAAAQEDAEINWIIRSLAPIAGQSIAGEEPNLIADPAPGLDAAPRPQTGLIEVVLQDQVILVDTSYSMDFEVYFPFDSAELTPLARRDLAALGTALSSEDLQPYRYLIAGHTDAVGQASYNQSLSERRAAAVRMFLIETFPIWPNRIVSIGFGQERPKVASQPRAAVNRRVEVLLIAGS